MNGQYSDDLSSFSLAELFRLEVDSQVAILTEGLLALERDPGATHWLEGLMRAAHSLKGAARIVGRDEAVRLTHVMEDCFVEAQKGTTTLPPARIDILLQGVDLLNRMAQVEEADAPAWDERHQAEFQAFLEALASPFPAAGADATDVADAVEATVAVETPDSAPPVAAPTFSTETDLHPSPSPGPETVPEAMPHAPSAPAAPAPPGVPATIVAPDVVNAVPEPPPAGTNGKATESSNRALRVSSDNLNRLMGLAGELVVTSRWSESFSVEMLRLKRMQQDLTRSLHSLREALAPAEIGDGVRNRLAEVQQRESSCRQLLDERMSDLESFDRRFVNLSSRLYQEVLECRMRPFADGIQGFPRMVRDVARSLGKSVHLEIVGEATLVDRDILERIEAPLGHLLRNSVDHGVESAQQRLAAGKPATAVIRLEAAHSAGMLLITVADDGGGIAPEVIRRAIVDKQLTSAATAETMSDVELMEFLFLPGFTMKQSVTDVSGRGVGLDAVQTMVREVGGTVRVAPRVPGQPGQGTQFQMQLPLTLSVIRALVVEIAGEPYAFPLARILGALRVERDDIETVQGRQHFTFGGQQIGLVTAHQILDLDSTSPPADSLPVIVLGNKAARYGVAIDRFLREQELVVRPLDPRLGKVKDISSAALLPDRSPVLIVDVEDLIRSIEILVTGGRVTQIKEGANGAHERVGKRVLVVDDSLTVRELERKLLHGKGYHVEVAVDGMDGWNAARAGQYELVITDVDMPRMDGIELVRLIKQDSRLKSVPVMIVSYKDREEDRQRGLEAGADYYLTKGSFHDESLLNAVAELIGEASE